MTLRLFVLMGLLVPSVSIAQEASPTFERDVAPLLATKCGKCHGQAKLEGGLDLRRRFLLVKGGDSGTAIVPGKPDESVLLQRVDRKSTRLNSSHIPLSRMPSSA